MRLYALRGATSVPEDVTQAIIDATEELLSELMQRNQLSPNDMVSCFFTCTPDLHAEFPAVAARRFGLGQVPLLCAQELDITGALERVIRIMIHCYLPEDHPREHVYLNQAVSLRQDLTGPQ